MMKRFSVTAISPKWVDQVCIEAFSPIEALHLAIEKLDPPEAYAIAMAAALGTTDAMAFSATGRVSCEGGSLSIETVPVRDDDSPGVPPPTFSSKDARALAVQLRSFATSPANAKRFMVAGVYLGSRDRYATTVTASTVEEAALVAHRQCRIDNLDGDAEMEICAVFEGTRHELLDLEEVEPAEPSFPIKTFKVVARCGDYEVEASSWLEAEAAFDAGQVACVVKPDACNVLTLGAKELVRACGYEVA